MLYDTASFLVHGLVIIYFEITLPVKHIHCLIFKKDYNVRAVLTTTFSTFKQHESVEITL